jgi:protease-4
MSATARSGRHGPEGARRWCPLLLFLAAALCLQACLNPKIRLFADDTDALEETTLQGDGRDKVLLLPVEGFLTDRPERGLLRSRPGTVQEVVARLRKAEEDDRVRALLLRIHSPGGTVTASDILFREIAAYAERSGARVVAVLMDVAASGGYYVALAAERIVAHPTTVTGSVGVIFIQPKIHGLMEKIGAGVDVTRSGPQKDMGSPFRESTGEERRLFQDIIDGMARGFLDRVTENRKLSPEALETVRTGRLMVAEEALRLGLVDRLGYLSDAFETARELAGLADDARLVVYRRESYPDDTPYHVSAAAAPGGGPGAADTLLERFLPPLETGFYYLWPAAIGTP